MVIMTMKKKQSLTCVEPEHNVVQFKSFPQTALLMLCSSTVQQYYNQTERIVFMLFSGTQVRPLTSQSFQEGKYSKPVAVRSHTHSPFPTASVCEVQMKQKYSWLHSLSIKTWTSCPGHSISHSGQCVCFCVWVWVQTIALSEQPTSTKGQAQTPA